MNSKGKTIKDPKKIVVSQHEIIIVTDTESVLDQTYNIESIFKNNKLNYILHDFSDLSSGELDSLKTKFAIGKIRPNTLPAIFINEMKYSFSAIIQMNNDGTLETTSRL